MEVKVRNAFIWVVFLIAFALVGCAGAPPLQEPEIRFVSLRPVIGDAGEQRFVVTLDVVNPNEQALNLKGVYYAVRLQGHKVASGVTDDVPVIGGFSETRIQLVGSVDVANSLRAALSVMESPSSKVHYDLELRLSIESWPFPLRLREEGRIAIADLVRYQP
ncbi:MAG: hypothetical protein CMK32_11695 [Porticoccaceae bacterium]|nr:hypothetical protein [Porticoccaceae bacterium]